MPAFDAHRPPEPSIIDDCVHCGFCLDSCPTYVLWGAEADSPRGRIVLMDEGLQEAEELSPEMVTHFDRCLGCMACVTACPSGVRYDRLIERVRPQVERHHSRSTAEQALRLLLFETLPHPKRLRALAPMLAAGRKLGAERLPERVAILAKVAPRKSMKEIRHGRVPERTAPEGPLRGRVGLLLGCVQRVFFGEVHQATVGALAAEGFEVLAPAAPDCCGALELHSGEEEAALARAAATVAAFSALGPLDHVVVNAAGCGAAMKEYGELLGTPEARSFSARVRDITELLADVEPRAPRGPVPLRVVYHDACHLAHAQGVRSQPRALLRGIPELELIEVPVQPEICCGSAGIYNLVQPQAAAELGAMKAQNLIDTGAEAIA
ncbi:MAG: glycolate oxidase iron-sulfur subunit, partial [Solirubrobacteraceae bacterium]|nr:glycolate oxidase iron-sulfur subunit [Solirubrobacteraceae bacterium]